MTTISVIIPAYNAQRTILETIKSVQEQTFKDFEIIAIDDGSSDRTLEILSKVKDEKLKVYSYANGGVSTARNRGIACAQGEYISFIDADDLWTSDKLEKQLAVLKANPQASVAYSWITLMIEAKDKSEDVTFISEEKVTFTGNVYSQLLLKNFLSNGSNILAKREAIESVGEFDSNLEACEDWDYYLRLAAKYHFVLVPRNQILYRKTQGTLSLNGSKMEQNGIEVINKAYQAAPKNLQHQKNRSLAKFINYCGRIYIDRSCAPEDIAKAKQNLWKAVKLNPPILLNRDTQILLFKIILKQLLPNRRVNSLISIMKKPFEMRKNLDKKLNEQK